MERVMYTYYNKKNTWVSFMDQLKEQEMNQLYHQVVWVICASNEGE